MTAAEDERLRLLTDEYRREAGLLRELQSRVKAARAELDEADSLKLGQLEKLGNLQASMLALVGHGRAIKVRGSDDSAVVWVRCNLRDWVFPFAAELDLRPEAKDGAP